MVKRCIIMVAALLLCGCQTKIELHKTETGYVMTTNAQQIRGYIETPDGIKAHIDTKKSNVVRDALQYLLTTPAAAGTKVEAK